MQSFETTPEKQALYRSTLADAPYPVQVVWGERDSAWRAAGADTIHRLPAKHFLQEDQADAVADLIATFVSS